MNKKALTEADIRTKFITPAVVGEDGPKWDRMNQLAASRATAKNLLEALGAELTAA